MSIPPGLLQDVEAFADVLAKLHAQQHTGAVTIHFAQGYAVRVELPGEPIRIKLDNGRRRRQA